MYGQAAREYLEKGRATLASVSADELLTEISVMHVLDEKGFDPIRVFPIVGVEEETGRYKVFDRGDMMRTEAKKRIDGEESAGKTIGVTEQLFACEPWALHYDLTDKKRKARGSPFANDSFCVKLLMQDLMIRRALEWSGLYMTTGNWGTDRQGGGVNFVSWSDAASNPQDDVIAWKTIVKNASGVEPNVGVITRDVWDRLQVHPDFVGRLQYTDAGPVALQYVAGLFGLDELMVLDVPQVTSAEGLTVTTAQIASQRMLLAYRTATPDKEVPSAGYTFSWSEFDEVKEFIASGGAPIRQFRMEHLKADRYEGEMYFDFRVVTPSAGLLAYNILT